MEKKLKVNLIYSAVKITADVLNFTVFKLFTIGSVHDVTISRFVKTKHKLTDFL